MKSSMYLFFLIAGLVAHVHVHAQETRYRMPQKGLCAHRGGLDTHPENTLPAFKNAVGAGVQMMEFDIQFSKDSMLVIMHDETVDRTTNGSGRISDLTLAQIRQLDAGIKKGPAFTGTLVPTLQETLAMMPINSYYASRAEEAAGLWNSGIDFILVNNLPLFLPVMKNYGIKEVKNEF